MDPAWYLKVLTQTSLVSSRFDAVIVLEISPDEETGTIDGVHLILIDTLDLV